MKICDIKANQGKIDVECEILTMEEPRIFNKFGKELKVSNAMVKDDSGEIKMSFWNDDIAKVSPGKKIKVKNGYCSEFKGEKQLSAGKFGSFEVCN
jgi:replication factor A1